MLTNIGHVTETLMTLIEKELLASGAESETFHVTAAPPDGDTGAGRAISVYLFHVLESPDLKNLPPRGGTSGTPARQQPMGLILQYIVTIVAPDSEQQDGIETLDQQRLIGFIARAIHDTPVVSDKTQILVPDDEEPTLVLHSGLRGMGTVLRFNLRPAPMEESVTFWTSQDKNVPRLSLFIEARVVLLESKPPEIVPGIVLSVGQFVFPNGGPQLIASRNTTFFLPPGAGEARSVQPRPARVALFENPPSASVDALEARNVNLLENNRLVIDATGLGPGQRILVLRSPRETIRLALDQLPDDVPAENQPWEIAATTSQVSLRVFERVVDAEGALRTIAPALYTARVIVLDDRVGVGNPPRPRSSNEIGLTIVPQILSVGPTPAPDDEANLYTLTLVTASLGPDSEVAFAVGGRPLTQVEDPPEPGEFRIEFEEPAQEGDPIEPVRSIRFRLPFVDPAAEVPVPIEPSVAEPLAIRLVIDGATANPEWLTEAAT